MRAKVPARPSARKSGAQLRRPISIHPPVYLARAPYDAWSPLRGVACVLWSSIGLRLRRLARFQKDKAPELGFNLFGTLPPDERNGVSLRPDRRDHAGVAALEVRIRFGDETDRMLADARARLLEILDDAGFWPSVRLWLVERPGTSVHYGGTVRMHASARYGMLDAWNRLHAAPNVLGVDSSTFGGRGVESARGQD